MSKFKAWYIPQVPMQAFEVERDTAPEAQAALDLITDFSIFEYANKIKPDYCDAGGVSEWDETAQEWFDYDPDEDEVPVCSNGDADCAAAEDNWCCPACWSDRKDDAAIERADSIRKGEW